MIIRLMAAVLLVVLAINSIAEDCFVKRATWQESLIASREALLAKETAWDNQQFSKTGMKIGDWYYVSFEGSKDAIGRVFKEWKPIDPEKPFNVGEKQYQLSKLPRLTPGKVYDLAELTNIEEKRQLYLFALLTVPEDMAEDTIVSLTASGTDARLWIRAGGTLEIYPRTKHMVEINTGTANITEKAGTYTALCYVSIARDTGSEFWYQPQVEKFNGVDMSRAKRLEARVDLFSKVRSAFPDPVSRAYIDRAEFRGLWPMESDWVPGNTTLITDAYKADISYLLTEVQNNLKDLSEARQGVVKQLVEDLKNSQGDSIAEVLRRHMWAHSLLELESLFNSFKTASMAVEHQVKVFDQYADGKKNLAELARLEQKADGWLSSKPTLGNPSSLDSLIKLTAESDEKIAGILLSNPLLQFEKLLVTSGGISLTPNWRGACFLGNKLEVLSPVSRQGKLTTVYEGTVSSYDLDWDAEKILFSDGDNIKEMKVDGSDVKVLKTGVENYNPCRMPDDNIMFVSASCQQTVPCTGTSLVGNMHLMDANGENERRITFDQDHNWDPCVLNSGRVIFTRWEYADTPHYFTRLLMSMNPDGTDQKEYYGSQSYWPNSMFWARPIPGHPSKVVTIVSGHHGTERAGELFILDPALGRREADGVVQRIPGYGKKVEPVIKDQLVDDSWPKFITPYPLGTSPQKDAAGTYFIATVQMDEKSDWQLCLVDIFDNITPILDGAYAMAVPLVKRAKPPVIPSRVNLESKTANAMIMNIYKGPGLRGYPDGSVKALRIGSYAYRYMGMGDTYGSSYEGGWDIKRILGTVPVQDDGSAFFTIPANTPIFVQPLDADGKSLQVMRSWFTGMPGENLSCIGCHESQNMAPPSAVSKAARMAPSKIKPWYGETRGFGFEHEIQPVLERRCVGCHDGQKEGRSDFRRKSLREPVKKYSPAYMELQKYVRRPGYESDYHMPVPAEYQADTSHLIKLLKKGHYNVRLTQEEWDRIYTWIDFNVPYPSIWREAHYKPRQESIDKRREALEKYAGIIDDSEASLPALPEPVAFIAPPADKAKTAPVSVKGWPFDPKANATVNDSDAGGEILELELSDQVTMKLVRIPAGEFVMGDVYGSSDEQPRKASVQTPFYMGTTEVSLRQYQQFNPEHENGYLSRRNKNVTSRGEFCMDRDDLPVVRISFNEAIEFCKWLSEKTGKKVTLPSEEQWEWACRAGSDERWYFGKLQNDVINIADTDGARWNHGRSEPGYKDKSRFVDSVNSYKPNAWGLYNMLGNVSEWTASDYTPLPDIGVVQGTEHVPYKVVRGGSWNDTARFATSASRWRYPPYQPVYDVGFRVVVSQ